MKRKRASSFDLEPIFIGHLKHMWSRRVRNALAPAYMPLHPHAMQVQVRWRTYHTWTHNAWTGTLHARRGRE